MVVESHTDYGSYVIDLLDQQEHSSLCVCFSEGFTLGCGYGVSLRQLLARNYDGKQELYFRDTHCGNY